MKTWIRVWDRLKVNEVASSLLVIGILNAECFSCHKIGLSKNSLQCPECGRIFRFVGFRKKAQHRDLDFFVNRQNLTLIDFDDFSKEFNRSKARKFLDPEQK